MSVFVGPVVKWVRVFKLNQSTKEWEEIQMLGSYSLYISRASSLSVIGRRSDMANRIYFSRFHREQMVYHSLDTKKYHFGTEDSLPDLYGTREHLDCAWIEVPQQGKHHQQMTINLAILRELIHF